MTMPIPLNSLPVIVDGPGDYVTRDGHRVTVRAVRAATLGTNAFGVEGSAWSERGGVRRARGNDVWHESGRHMVTRDSGRDLVGRWKASAST